MPKNHAGDGSIPAEFGVADSLHSAAIHLLRRVRTQDSSSGVGPAQLSALSVLVFGGPMRLGQLADAEQVKPPTMTRIVSGLEAAGLAERLPDRGDARRVRIRASAKGVRVLHSARHKRISYLSQYFATLKPGELQALREAARLLEKALQAVIKK